jgi:translation initiation factor 2 subunit 1
MLRKDGYPEENELVICTVTKIQHHSVFCSLDEYENKSGMLHISEISAGRVRNITEYVKEGKTIVCKVLKLDREKGYIDLSLRRVTESQKKAKATSIKKYQSAFKLVEAAAQEAKLEAQPLWDELDAKKDSFESVFDLFQAVVEGTAKLPLTGPALAAVQKTVLERLKPARVSIKGQLEIVSYDPNGVGLIKDAFAQATSLSAAYLGGGRYGITVIAKDYKKAEAALKTDLDAITKKLEKRTAKVVFARTDR